MNTRNPWHTFLQVSPYVRRILLHSEAPGTGKTTAGIMLAESRQVPLTVVTLTDAMTVSDLFGHWIPRGKEFLWHDGPISRAIRAGKGVLVLNELDHAGPDVAHALYWLLDSSIAAQCVLPSGETMHVPSALTIVGTMNATPDTLPTPVLDRFQVKLDMGAHVSPMILDALPPALAGMVADARLSSREAFALAELTNAGCPTVLAAEAILGPQRSADYADALALAIAE